MLDIVGHFVQSKICGSVNGIKFCVNLSVVVNCLTFLKLNFQFSEKDVQNAVHATILAVCDPDFDVFFA